MKCTSVLLLCSALILTGCIATFQDGNGAAPANSALTIDLSLGNLGMELGSAGARLYVDGRFVGNYKSEGSVLYLSPGTHTIKVEVPRAYRRIHNPDGTTSVPNYSVTGQEKIQILSGNSKQNLVFNDTNLKASPVSDE